MPVNITDFTYGSAIVFICKMVGHPVPADPAGADDSAVQQMGTAVNVALGELLTMHEWQDLTVKATLPIVGDFAGQKEKAFVLPTDFYRFIDQTQWGQQTMLPALGPVSNQAWMGYTVRNWTPQLTLFWQMRNDKLNVLNPPFPNPVNFEFMYLSRAQVIDQDDPTLFKNTATKNGDKFFLDGALAMLLGRARYLEWKGFDASAALRDFLTVYDSRAGSDKAAPVLSLSPRYGLPFINAFTSLPDTGYGS
jgi:hypothetical protein